MCSRHWYHIVEIGCLAQDMSIRPVTAQTSSRPSVFSGNSTILPWLLNTFNLWDNFRFYFSFYLKLPTNPILSWLLLLLLISLKVMESIRIEFPQLPTIKQPTYLYLLPCTLCDLPRAHLHLSVGSHFLSLAEGFFPSISFAPSQ